MFPTLFSIGSIAISTLGFFIALGFLLASFLIWKKGKEEGYDESKLMDGIFLVTISGFVNARLWYLVWHFVDFDKNFFKAFSVIKIPGFSWFGAFLAGLLVLASYCNKNKWDFFKTADLFVFGLCLGQAFGLIGSFFDGSFYGKATNLPWGIKFPGLEQLRHPTQLYLLLLVLLILRLLFIFDKNYRTYEWYKNKRGESGPGFLFLSYLMLFSASGFIVDFVRERTLYFWQMSSDQLFWLLTFLAAFGFLYSRSGLDAHGKILKLVLPQKKEVIKVLSDQNKPVERTKIKKSRTRFKTGMEAK